MWRNGWSIIHVAKGLGFDSHSVRALVRGNQSLFLTLMFLYLSSMKIISSGEDLQKKFFQT